ncbi:hypothetical protein B0H66DRAFT_544671 [Apodospora peruviana]|uniref:Uncharacterized protein n=1 Tax=Apodospora peruviana TaxID=516989 RepID=A0AAE0ITA8_9PEZI|nr:hypothetical protein B0H66DRAFT_544671 [Apodospora peruviana]
MFQTNVCSRIYHLTLNRKNKRAVFLQLFHQIISPPQTTKRRTTAQSRMSGLLNMSDDKTKDTQSGASGAAKTVTSTLGNTVGGVTNTAGGILGAAGRGIGDTVNSVTGEAGRPVGDGISNIGSGIEGAGQQASQGVKNAGEWKKA